MFGLIFGYKLNGLIVGPGCSKRVDLKATIQLHCIPVKKKEGLLFRGSKHRAERMGLRAEAFEFERGDAK